MKGTLATVSELLAQGIRDTLGKVGLRCKILTESLTLIRFFKPTLSRRFRVLLTMHFGPRAAAPKTALSCFVLFFRQFFYIWVDGALRTSTPSIALLPASLSSASSASDNWGLSMSKLLTSRSVSYLSLFHFFIKKLKKWYFDIQNNELYE